jgi:NAD(P)-dependent dehydrogenase (short-subunit alcohol dehydrogenase family)
MMHIAAIWMIASSAPSPSSPAPSARRYAALGLDRSARPSKGGNHAANAYQAMPTVSKISARQTASDRSGTGFLSLIHGGDSTAAAEACYERAIAVAARYAGGSGYCASKFAVVGLTQSLAMELAPQGVRVNAVCPGILGTHMWTHHLASRERGGRAAYEGAIRQMIPLGREQTPEDVAGAVLYLARAPNVTGVALNVAGGMEVW